jgi:hypothetical protein
VLREIRLVLPSREQFPLVRYLEANVVDQVEQGSRLLVVLVVQEHSVFIPDLRERLSFTLAQRLVQLVHDLVHDLLRTLAEGTDVVKESLTQRHAVLQVLVR